MRLCWLFLALPVLLFTSCGNDLNVLSKDDIRNGSRSASRASGTYKTAQPSARTVAAGHKHPKDKHGMPLYTKDRLRHVRTTAYTCSESDHLEYGSMNAAGTPLRYSSRVRSAAADWSVYPIGTTFRIKGMPQLFVVDDYGSALTGTGTIDIYTPSKGHMNEWGCRKVEIAIVRWGSYERSASLLSKRTGYSHCRQMYTSIQRKMRNGTATAMR